MTTANRKIRVLLADDHAVVREGLKRLIEATEDIEVQGEASTGNEAIDKALAFKPEIVVMDVSMPDLDGIHATRRLKRSAPGIKVLGLTVFEDAGHLRTLLEAGASGYVLKRSAGDELIRAIRSVIAGGVYLDPVMAAKVVNNYLRPDKKAPQVELSEREESVLRLIAEGYSNKEIAAQIGVSFKTVETYKARAMEKLALKSRVELVRYAASCGWLAGQP